MSLNVPKQVEDLAGAPRFELGLSVLETDVLTINTIPPLLR